MEALFTISQNVMDTLEMDSNTFYPMIVTLFIAFVVPVFKFIWDKWVQFDEQRKNNLFELHCKRENDYFYGYILLCEMFGMVLGGLVAIGIDKCIPISHVIDVLFIKTEVVFGLIFFVISVGWSILVTRMVWVRKRIIADKKGKGIIAMSILALHISSLYVIYGEKYEYVFLLSVTGYLIIEIVGLLYFQGRFVEYRFSKLNIFLGMGEEIRCEDIEKVKRNRNFVIVESQNKVIILKYDAIMKVEYYGGPKIVLNKK